MAALCLPGAIHATRSNHMLKGRTIEQKRKLAARITDAMMEEARAVKEAVVVTFIEITREDYANAGVLLTDKK